MSIGVLRRHTRDRLESLQRLVEAPKIEGPLPPTPEDYQELVSVVLEFPDPYRRVVDAELRRVFTDRSRSIVQLQQLRSELADMADRYTSMVRRVEEDAALRALAKKHLRFDVTTANLAEAVATVQHDQARLVAEWPVCSPEELAQVPALSEQGRCLPIDQAFADMKGIAADELHRRLDEHKARRKGYGWE